MGSRLVADVISELGYLKETVETERIQITLLFSVYKNDPVFNWEQVR